MDLRITGRDLASPQDWGRARPGMCWHHIIPFSRLRDVWNRLIDQHLGTERAEARTAMRQYLLLVDRSLTPDIEVLLERMRAGNIAQRRANQPDELSIPEVLRLTTAAVWPAWNSVEGPQRRSDDPQDRYFDRFTSGLRPEETVRMNEIGQLFIEFDTFIHSGPAPSAASLRSLAQAASRSGALRGCDAPIRFGPDMWVDEGAGLWRKAR